MPISEHLIAEEGKIFSRKLREAREDAKLSQDQVSAITGLTQPFISDVENGKTSVSIYNASKLSQSVGKRLWELFYVEK